MHPLTGGIFVKVGGYNSYFNWFNRKACIIQDISLMTTSFRTKFKIFTNYTKTELPKLENIHSMI